MVDNINDDMVIDILNGFKHKIITDKFVSPSDLDNIVFDDDFIKEFLIYMNYAHNGPFIGSPVKNILDGNMYLNNINDFLTATNKFIDTIDSIIDFLNHKPDNKIVVLFPGDSISKLTFAAKCIKPDVFTHDKLFTISFPISDLHDEENHHILVAYLRKIFTQYAIPLDTDEHIAFVVFDYMTEEQRSFTMLKAAIHELFIHNPNVKITPINIRSMFKFNGDRIFSYIVKSDPDMSRCQYKFKLPDISDYLKSGKSIVEYQQEKGIDTCNYHFRCNLILYMIYLYIKQQDKIINNLNKLIKSHNFSIHTEKTLRDVLGKKVEIVYLDKKESIVKTIIIIPYKINNNITTYIPNPNTLIGDSMFLNIATVNIINVKILDDKYVKDEQNLNTTIGDIIDVKIKDREDVLTCMYIRKYEGNYVFYTMNPDQQYIKISVEYFNDYDLSNVIDTYKLEHGRFESRINNTETSNHILSNKDNSTYHYELECYHMFYKKIIKITKAYIYIYKDEYGEDSRQVMVHILACDIPKLIGITFRLFKVLLVAKTLKKITE